jgi:hypothetical protein
MATLTLQTGGCAEGLATSHMKSPLLICYKTERTFTNTQLIENQREHYLPTYVGFSDYEKAFNRIDRNKLWDVMVVRSSPENLMSHKEHIFKHTNNNGK